MADRDMHGEGGGFAWQRGACMVKGACVVKGACMQERRPLKWAVGIPTGMHLCLISFQDMNDDILITTIIIVKTVAKETKC